MRAARDAIGLGQARWLGETYAAQAVLAGNWHEPRYWGRTPDARHSEQPAVVIPGTLCPHSFSDADFVGRVGMWDTSTLAYSSALIPGPRFHVRGVNEIEPLVNDAGLFYLRIVANSDDELRVAEGALLRLQSAGQVRAVEIVDAREHDAEIKASVQAARRDPEVVIREALQVEEPGTTEGALARLAAYRSEATR
jgi:hypothetical protein